MQYFVENKKEGVHYEVYEEIDQCPNITNIGSSSYASGMRAAPLEVHENAFEIHHVKQGHQLFVVDDHLIPLKAGEFLVTRPNQVHGPAHGIILPSTLSWVRIRTELPEGFSEPEAALITGHLQDIAGKACIESTPYLGHALDNIIRLLGREVQDLPTRTVLKHHELAMISALLNLELPQNLNPKRALMVERITNTIERMGDSTNQHYNIPGLAKTCQIGETLYRRLFKEITGFTPTDYIHFSRIVKAITLLRQGHSITDTAFDLGYSSSQHFSRTFTKWTGGSPSSYKRQTEQDKQVISRSSDRAFYQTLTERQETER
jgi:AraC family L-rhamnose operon regulatory protein RhaS